MSDADRPRALFAWLTWGFVGAAVLMLAILSQRVERTADESNYLRSGRRLVALQPLDRVEHRFQGPLILLGTQITDQPEGNEVELATVQSARLGMLVFPITLLVMLVVWTRTALGERAGLLTAGLAATNPTLLAYGPLLSSDVAYTAMALCAAFAAWRWLGASRLRDAVALGVAFGATAATKYTGVFSCVVIAGVLFAASAFGFDPRPAAWRTRPLRWAGRAALTALAVGAMAAIALLVLYACYLFASPPFGGKTHAFESGAMRAIAGLPGARHLLALLPEPFVLGVDLQAWWSVRRENGSFLDRCGSHWPYYPTTVLLKTPLPLLALAGFGIAAWRRGAGTRALWACAVVPPVALLAYVTATRALQMGVRYVLPIVPALLMLAGAFARDRWASTRAGRALLALAGIWSVWVVVSGWPHFIGYFNPIAGGPAAGFRIVADGNCDWSQRLVTGKEALRARHPELVFLRAGQGPRFGRVAAYASDLKAVDPRDATRTYHWLVRFTPFDHDGAAWLAFDVTPEAFANGVDAGDTRAAEDLAFAWLHQRDFAQARAAVQRAGADAVARVTPLIDVVEAVERGDASRRDEAVDALSAASQFDLALGLLSNPRRSDAARVFWLMLRTGQPIEAVDRLEAAGADGSRTTEEAMLLALSLCGQGGHYTPDPPRAARILAAGPAPAPGSPAAAAWDELAARVRAMVEHDERTQGRYR